MPTSTPKLGPILAFGLCFALMAAWACSAGLEVAPDHILVKFKPEIAENLKSVALNEGLGELLIALRLPQGTSLSEPVLNRLQREQRQQGLDRSPTKVDLTRFMYLGLPPGLSVNECVQRVGRHPWVEYAEPDGVGSGGLIPNDPDFSSQWHHRNLARPSACIQTPLAWDITLGSTNVIVAVLDTGLT